MLGICIDPPRLAPELAHDPRLALRGLASVAKGYLKQLDAAVAAGVLNDCGALVTRVRGTGPGVSFGKLVSAIEDGFPLDWTCPFEGSLNVSGASLTLDGALRERRDDGFLFLRFRPHTTDLPLHIHPQSDRFIFVIGGRGFFHVASVSPGAIRLDQISHLPARDRDALMFRRRTVHTFSTAEHPLVLLSYHRPFVPLNDEAQYECSSTPMFPRDFLSGHRSQVSFDAAWTIVEQVK